MAVLYLQYATRYKYAHTDKTLFSVVVKMHTSVIHDIIFVAYPLRAWTHAVIITLPLLLNNLCVCVCVRVWLFSAHVWKYVCVSLPFADVFGTPNVHSTQSNK